MYENLEQFFKYTQVQTAFAGTYFNKYASYTVSLKDLQHIDNERIQRIL